MGSSFAKIQKSVSRERGVRAARDPRTSDGDDRRGATRPPETRTRRTLTCSSVSLNFPTSPLVKSHPGRWSSNCVGFRGLGPATSVPACEDRDVAPGRLGPTTPRFTRIASSAGGRARREPRVPRRASRVARNGKPERRAFPMVVARYVAGIGARGQSAPKHPASLEGPTLAREALRSARLPVGVRGRTRHAGACRDGGRERPAAAGRAGRLRGGRGLQPRRDVRGRLGRADVQPRRRCRRGRVGDGRLR